jgi:hypothetical protein
MKAGRELDALVAEKIFGWRRMSWKDYHAFQKQLCRYNGTDSREELTYGWHDAEGNMVNGRAEDCDDYYSPEAAWSPSSDIAAAWQVVERFLLDEKGHVDLSVEAEGVYCRISCYSFDGDGIADTAPLAICLAALKAVADRTTPAQPTVTPQSQ